MSKNMHIGSDFDDFLKEEGIFEDCDRVARKRVLAFQIEQEMKEQNITKTKLAKIMKTSRATIDRLLDATNPSLTLTTLENVASALGKRLEIKIC
ncbi:MAG: helix-turn-helix domain-containing protein [Campylobacterales bacterium]